jgi:hypothetical protein
MDETVFITPSKEHSRPSPNYKVLQTPLRVLPSTLVQGAKDV